MALTKKEIKEIVELLKEQAEEQAKVSNSLEDYIVGLKKLKAIEEEVTRLIKLQGETQIKLDAAKLRNDADEIANQQEILDLLRNQTYELHQKGNALRDNLKVVNKTNLLMAKGGASLVKTFANLPNIIEKSYGKIKTSGLFELDKSVKKSALSMGLMNSQTSDFTRDIRAASWDTNQIGINVAELAQMQANYNEELGRTVMLNQTGLKAMGDMAAATSLGAEGTAKMAADMAQQGLSAESTRDFVEETMNDAHKMGLNASKVVKNVQQNMKMLNKYNFKNGIKGLAKMAQTTTKLGVDMNFVAGMAEKLFDIEGAVDMSAQLQVMGGEWSKLADPFHLMYMARNDMEGLADELGKAAQSSVHFNRETGEFQISALEMHRLRKIAEQTGVAYEDLATAGKNAAIFSKIKGQVGFNVSKDTQEFLQNTAKFDNNGKAYIEMDFGSGKTSKKYLSQLSASDQALLNTTVQQRKTLEEYGKDSRTFDDALNNTINALKVSLLPLIDEMNKNLIPKLDSFVSWVKKSHWLDRIEYFAKIAGQVISTIGGLIIDNPLISAFTYGVAKFTGLLINNAMWVSNGLLLAKGFNMGASVGGPTSSIGGGRLTKGSPMNKKMMRGLKGGGAAALLGGGIHMANNFGLFGEEGSTGEKNMGMAASALEYGGAGAMLGSMILPGWGTAIGAGLGGLYGLYEGGLFGQETHDGLFEGKKLGADFSKGRGLIQNGKITPIDNKDDLIAMKPNGAIDRASKSKSNDNQPSTVKHEFSELRINGELRLTMPGHSASSVDLLKSPEFVRSITEKIQVEVKRNINQIQKP